MNWLTRIIDRFTAWIDAQTAEVLAATASDDPAINDSIEQLDFQAPCSAGTEGLIRMEPPCEHTAEFAVTINPGGGAAPLVETWCGCCLETYLAVLRISGANTDLHAERL